MACELGASVVRAHNVPETMKALKKLRPYVILGLGSNVALVANPGEETEGKIANLEQAITGLCSIPDTQIIDISSYYESEPAYYEDQDTFVNAVVLARTGVPPKELLKYLHAIENSLGRTREIENGPRTLDLDIVDYQMYVGQTDRAYAASPARVRARFRGEAAARAFAEPCARRRHARCRRWRGIRKGNQAISLRPAQSVHSSVFLLQVAFGHGVHANPMPACYTSKTFPLNNVQFCPHGRWRARRCKELHELRYYL